MEIQITDAERERLACIAEEASELAQNCMKAIRHGLDSRHPQSGISNRQLIAQEVGDLLAMLGVSAEQGDFSLAKANDSAHAKLDRVGPFMHFNHVMNGRDVGQLRLVSPIPF
jgi:NTP pyrophosphatase (non-canonical NTP hydrolase)